MLRKPAAIRSLRAAGWTLPEEVRDDAIIQVYDTRLDPAWSREVVTEVGMGLPASLIGGDFLTAPSVDDKTALDQTRLMRWGPPPATTPTIFLSLPGPIRRHGWSGRTSNLRWKPQDP